MVAIAVRQTALGSRVRDGFWFVVGLRLSQMIATIWLRWVVIYHLIIDLTPSNIYSLVVINPSTQKVKSYYARLPR